MNNGFIRVAAATPVVRVADPDFNRQEIESLAVRADGLGAEVVVFPELCVTGCTCGDLFADSLLIEGAEIALMNILNNTRQLDIICIVGMPVRHEGKLFDCAVVMQGGVILGVVPKSYLPESAEAGQQRWFASASYVRTGELRLCGQKVPVSAGMLFHTVSGAASSTFGVEIGEDLQTPVPPSGMLALQGAEIIFNLSAVPAAAGREGYIVPLVAQQSVRCVSGYVAANAGWGESSTDLVFPGGGLIFDNGQLVDSSEFFLRESALIVGDVDLDGIRHDRRVSSTFRCCSARYRDLPVVDVDARPVNCERMGIARRVSRSPFVPQGDALAARCREILSIQCSGLARRLSAINCRKVVIGVSGGLDSTQALLVCARTFDMLGLSRRGIIAVTMPGFGTSDRTYSNALRLMEELGVSLREVSIRSACEGHFADIGHDMEVRNVVYENGQARERTQILMDLANQAGGLVVGTGDLSELALGWCTYNGDHMSMYNVNGGVPKTLMQSLVRWVAENSLEAGVRETLIDIVETPISPELIPAADDGQIKQRTEDLVGPYELHDFFLYHFIRHGSRPRKIFALAVKAFEGVYDEVVIKKWLVNFFRRFFAQQYKRSACPDGPGIGSVGLSPRGGWVMPSDASSVCWLKECEEL